MPRDLLDLLTETPQGGERLAERLGVGRVTVHNRARLLAEQGVPVVVNRAGYALARGTPTEAALQPRGVLGRAYRYVGTTGSTQDDLRAWDGAPHGAVILAERQTAGRGRRGRTWESPGHALLFSVLLRDGRAFADLALLPLAAGVALHEACVVGALKWPNDLLAPDGRKLAGVLLEADIRGEEVRRAVLGIGLNVDAAPDGAASLAEFRSVSRVDLLRDLLERLEVWSSAPADAVLDAWRARNGTLGHEVRVVTPRGEVRGVALDIGGDGALLVRTARGSLTRVTAGDVSLVSPLPTPDSPDQDDIVPTERSST